MDFLTPGGSLPISQNIFELDNAMSRMKVYSELAQTAVDQATAAADRADAAADRAAAAWGRDWPARGERHPSNRGAAVHCHSLDRLNGMNYSLKIK